MKFFYHSLSLQFVKNYKIKHLNLISAFVKKSNLPLKEALTADITGASVSRLGNTRDRGGPSTGPSTCDVRSGCNVRTGPSTWSVLSKGSAVVPIINIKLLL